MAIAGLSVGAVLHTLYTTQVTGTALVVVKGVVAQTIQANPTLTNNGFNTEPYYMGTIATTLANQFTGATTPILFKSNCIFLVLKQSTMNGDILKLKVEAFKPDGITPIDPSLWSCEVSYVDFAQGSYGANHYTEILQGAVLTGTANIYTLPTSEFPQWTYDQAGAIGATHNTPTGSALCVAFTFQPIYAGNGEPITPQDVKVSLTLETGTA